jgi:argininosuccinate lyase
MKLWEGRSDGQIDPLAARLNDSLAVDRRLGAVDVRASQAWARALGAAGVVSADEVAALVDGLNGVAAELESGSFVFLPSDEDIHTAVERRLGERIGPLAGKLHTGRSRNDQVVTDFRLWLMGALPHMDALLTDLQAALVERARQDLDVVLPGYTHLQQAQPVLLTHWELAHFWALERDHERLGQMLDRVRVLPLGSGALAGTAFPIDRFALATDLGFAAPSPNSLDAVSDRDFVAEFLFWAALLGVHLSRMAEALLLFSTAEFGFITLADAYTTGSSLMPQKKNADTLELVRGKSAELLGDLVTLLATLKALPSAYDKDLQADKSLVFSACDLLELLLPVTSGVLRTLTVNAGRMRADIDPAVLATDLADQLVQKGVPFREAHHAVGRAVRRAGELGVALNELPLAEWQALHPAFDAGLYEVFDVERALARRGAYGGTAPGAVRTQLQEALAKLGERK